MKVVLVPYRLRLATGVLALCIPLAAIETILVTRAPWWKLPYQSIAIWSAASALLCVPLAAWMSSGRRWALHLTAFSGLVWCLLSAWTSIRTKNPNLGFFTLLLLTFWSGTWLWLKHEMGRSFFDPRLKWYQGLPKPIPGLSAQIVQGEKRSRFRVCRIDRDGAFVFFEGEGLSGLSSTQRMEMSFRFKEREVRCVGLPVRLLNSGSGLGLQFQGMSADAMKELGDFVEILRGEGHV